MCVNTRVLISICVEVAPNADVGPYNTCVEPSILVVKEMVVVDTPVVGVMEENWRVGMPQMETRLLPESEMRRRLSGNATIPTGELNLSSP